MEVSVIGSGILDENILGCWLLDHLEARVYNRYLSSFTRSTEMWFSTYDYLMEANLDWNVLILFKFEGLTDS